MGSRLLVTALILSTALTAQPEIGGCPVFPASNIWNTAIDKLPLDPNSALYVETIGRDRPMHPDYGSGLFNGGPIGIPFILVPGTQTKLRATFLYASESDPGPYAIPLDAPIEGGSQSTGDRHAIAIDRDNCILYELFNAFPQADGTWKADSGAIFDLRSHRLRPNGWTSADAAGLPIVPGLVRYEEMAAGEIRHAIRFTARQTRRAFLWPARHFASRLTEDRYPPMGQRFRLRADYDISGFHPENQVILRALKKYGIILADNGSDWFISGAPDERWNNTRLREIRRLMGADFEAVDMSSLMIDPNSGEARQTPAASPVVHAATNEYAPISPGLIVSIYGSGFGSPAVLFNSVQAPVLFSSPTQINTIAPYAVAGSADVRVEVRAEGRAALTETLPFSSTSPGIFAITNQNYTLNSRLNPATSNSVLVLFGTGEGQTDPAGVDGKVAAEVLPKPIASQSVRIGGRSAQVLYAGAAPGLVSGVVQVNVTLPPGLAAGEHPVIWMAGLRQASSSVWVQ